MVIEEGDLVLTPFSTDLLLDNLTFPMKGLRERSERWKKLELKAGIKCWHNLYFWERRIMHWPSQGN